MKLKDLQRKIDELENKNKWNNSADQKIVFITEELGEIAKWVRKSRKSKLTKKDKENLNFELADILQHIVSLANTFGLDLEKGLKQKKGL